MLETYRNLTIIGYSWEDHTIEEHCQSSKRNERHQRNQSEEKPAMYNWHGKDFAYDSQIQRHKRSHIREQPYECNQCGKAYAYQSALQIHKRRRTREKPYECNQCGKAFSYPSNLQVHKRTHTGEKPYKCNQCGKAFAYHSNFQLHKRRHTGQKPYECNQCGKVFAYHSDFQLHKRRHTGEKPYKCNQCGKAFVCHSDLQKHKRTHTGEKPHECIQCGKAYACHRNLQRHKRIHSGEKPYECNLCGKAFTCDSNLHVHKRMHSGEKPYECNQCGKAFAYDSHFQLHKRKHTGSKPYECNECDKVFASHSALQLHKRIHTGQKPYECNQYGKAFVCHSDLQRHKRRHTGDKPYECNQCAFEYNNKLCGSEKVHTKKILNMCELCSPQYQTPCLFLSTRPLEICVHLAHNLPEPLNIVTDSQYAERVVLHIETAEFIPDESELTSLFIQLQDIIRNRKHPLYVTHIRSHTGLPGPLAQGNDKIDKLLIGNVLEASEFHKKHHVNTKGLKRDFSITWQQAKEIVRKCPTCSFYNQTPLPAGCNPKGTQRNEIWKMDVFPFAEFGKLKYVHHTIDTYSGFQWATALSSEKADSVITHLLEVMAIMGIPAQIKTDNAPAYVSGKMKQFFAYYNIKHITGIPHNPTGQAVIERSNRTLKDMLNKQKGVTKTPRNRLHNALLTLNFLNANEKRTTAAERHWIIEKTAELNQPVYFKDVLTSEWKPGYVLRCGRGFAFISTGEDNLWIPSKLIKEKLFFLIIELKCFGTTWLVIKSEYILKKMLAARITGLKFEVIVLTSWSNIKSRTVN
ncbi:hypothetical protein STEG23_037991, partial [Scotinomys teguina]